MGYNEYDDDMDQREGESLSDYTKRVFAPRPGDEVFNTTSPYESNLNAEEEARADNMFETIRSSLFTLYIASAFIVVFSIIRLYASSSVEISENGQVLSTVDSPILLEPHNYTDFLSVYTGLAFWFWIVFSVLSFLPQGFSYKWNGTQKSFSIPFIPQITLFLISTLVGVITLFSSSSSTFEQTVEHIHGDEQEYGGVRIAQQNNNHNNNNNTNVSSYSNINSFVKSFSGEKPKGNFLTKNSEPTYRLFYIVNREGKPHLLASKTFEVKNTNQIKDLGAMTETEKDTLIRLTAERNWMEKITSSFN